MFVYDRSREPHKIPVTAETERGMNVSDQKRRLTGSRSREVPELPRGPRVSLPGQGGRERDQPRLAIRDWFSSSSPSRLTRSSPG